jgi:predicted RNase H-like HicB family nuclease
LGRYLTWNFPREGASNVEAFENIREALELWIEGKLEGGFSVPVF